MNLNTQKILKKRKPHIGFLHGSISLIGAIILSYLIMMVFSKYMPGDYAVKIIPSIIITPILISITGLWLLFSHTIILSLIKFLVSTILLSILIKVFS